MLIYVVKLANHVNLCRESYLLQVEYTGIKNIGANFSIHV